LGNKWVIRAETGIIGICNCVDVVEFISDPFGSELAIDLDSWARQ
jgi:hypothetical protein